MTLPVHAARRALTPVFLALCLGAPALGQAGNDSILLRSGTTESGKIRSEDYAGIVFDPPRGEARTVAWSDIAPAGITYASAPDYQAAKDLFDAGRLADSLTAFQALKADARLRNVLKQQVLYHVPLIQQRQGRFDDALAGYEQLLKDFPKSRWLYEVGENIVLAHAAKGDAGEALRALDKLATEALNAGVDASFGAAVNVLKGRVFEEQKKHAEARAAYGVAAKAAGLPASIVHRAQLGEARCAVALNNRSEAETGYRNLVTKDAANAVLAGAWNGLGDMALEDGQKANNNKGDADRILDALYMYLRGIVQYGPLPGEPTREHERALAGAARCFRFLSQLETNAERKRLYQDRSTEHLNRLAQEFPDSPFLKNR